MVFTELMSEKYPGFQRLFTDGSRSGGSNTRVGVGMVVPSHKYTAKWKLHPDHSILTAELYGLLQALLYLQRTKTNQRAVIWTDSLSSLHLLTSNRTSYYSSLVQDIHKIILSFPVGAVQLQWIPAHSEIRGNELGDTAAKEAAKDNLPVTEIPFSYSEGRTIITNKIWEFFTGIIYS